MNRRSSLQAGAERATWAEGFSGSGKSLSRLLVVSCLSWSGLQDYVCFPSACSARHVLTRVLGHTCFHSAWGKEPGFKEVRVIILGLELSWIYIHMHHSCISVCIFASCVVGIEPGIIREPCMVTCSCNPSACEVGDDSLPRAHSSWSPKSTKYKQT